MSNEITVQVALSRTDSTNTVNSHNYPSTRKLINQTLKRHSDQFFAVGTSEESPSFTDITTFGQILMINTDATNYVDWGIATGVYTGRMLAGESAGPFRITTGVTLYLKANTASCDVRIILYGA
jgi:hypothetical protein